MTRSDYPFRVNTATTRCLGWIKYAGRRWRAAGGMCQRLSCARRTRNGCPRSPQSSRPLQAPRWLNPYPRKNVLVHNKISSGPWWSTRRGTHTFRPGLADLEEFTGHPLVVSSTLRISTLRLHADDRGGRRVHRAASECASWSAASTASLTSASLGNFQPQVAGLTRQCTTPDRHGEGDSGIQPP